MVVRSPRPNLSGRPRLLAPVLVIVAVLVVLISVAVGLWTDLLWFRSVDYSGVFTTILRTRVLLFLGFGVLMALVVGVNIVVAYRSRPPFRPMSLEQQNLERYRVAIEPLQRTVLIGAASLLGLFAGLSAASRWQTWMLWRNRTDFGVADPQFGRDVSYYAFSYPFYRFVLGFLLAAVVLALVAAAVTHYLYGGLRLQTQGEKVSPAARAHLSVLLGVFVLLKAFAYYLDRFGLVFAERGFVQGGAAYTDVNAVLPAKNILIGVAVICALLFFANVVVRNVLLPGGALALLVLAAVVLGGILPAYTQQFRVKPNELERESQFIERNIEGTRAGYGIDDVEIQAYGGNQPPVAEAVDPATPPNARLLDPNELAPTFQQLERLRQYFGVTDALDIDRYEVDGDVLDYVVAAREVDQSGLSDNQRNWVNERLTYTHGNGLIAARADKVDNRNRPIFATPGISSAGEGAFRVDNPQIYFGELSPSYSIATTDQPEQDGPLVGSEEDVADFRYDGDGGVQLSNFGRKLAYALKFREPNLVLSGAIQSESRIMYDRSPRERVKKAAPFLEIDADPYPAIVDGRILWIVDGYTTSNQYPYSRSVEFGDVTTDSQTGRPQPRRQVNYIRNSVKATVDAYTGAVKLYAFGDRDPVLETWNKAFGGIVEPQSAISSELRDHLRYPEDLFKVQRDLLGIYHVTDPGTFFLGSEAWAIPSDPAKALRDRVAAAPGPGDVTNEIDVNLDGPRQPPYYSQLAFPGEDGQQFRLSTTFVFNERPNLAAFASVSSDPEDYGTIQILQLPGGNPPFGPGQVANQFLTDERISESLFRFRQQNNAEVIFGNLLTLPTGGGLLYVQPVYVRAQGDAGFPTLQSVLTAYGDSVGTGANLAESLRQLLIKSSLSGPDINPAVPDLATTPSEPPSDTAPPEEAAPPLTGGQTQALSEALSAYDEGQAALARGDFAGFGAAQERIKVALDRIEELQGGEPAPTTTPPSAGPTPAPSPS